MIFGDLVMYGPSGGDWGSKNWIGAFKLDRGEEVWRFNLIPDANEPGTDSVGALDVKTGKLLWYDKFVAIDMHDWDLSQVSPIFRAPSKGKERNLLTVTGKDGFLRMIDRDSRELLYEMPITTRENADAEPTVSGVHICPGLLGGVEWSGPPWIPKAIPCSWSRSTGAESSRDTGGSVGGGVISYELDGKQYVATTSGVISGFFGGSGTSAVIIFALP